MKTFYSLLILFLLCFEMGFSQNIKWAVSESSPNTPKKLLADLDSNVYVYGNRYMNGVDPASPGYNNVLTDTTGSYFEKFSPQGNLLMYKNWTGGPFYIQQIIYDGNQYYYFTGFFAGNISLDSISISSKGRADGFIGRMNANGSVLWIRTFGSSKDEIGQSLCFNANKTSLLLTGHITDSLVISNTFMAKGNQSTLMAEYSLVGVFQNYRLYDFLPVRNNVFGTETGLGNFGREIVSDNFGNYYLLTDREGKHPPCCSSDTLNAPIEGRYIYKLNSNLDTVWSTYITGPQCYYGNECHSLRIGSNGDPFIMGYCSAHYGGDGFVERLDKNTGLVAWSDIHQDGGYGDLFIEGNTLFTCGTDSATYCPCPDDFGGYQALKTFDQSNNILENIKFNGSKNFSNNLTFRNIARDMYGYTYVAGVFNAPSAVLGNYTLTAGTSNFYIMKIGNMVATSIDAKQLTTTDQAFNVYPNPTNGVFEIRMAGKELETLICRIYDMMGKIVYDETFSNQANGLTKKIDLSNHAKGLYMIELSNGTEKNYRKIVVE